MSTQDPLKAVAAAQIGRRETHLVQGEHVLRLNPADGAIASRFLAMRGADAAKAASRAAQAFGDWSAKSGAERAAILRRASALMAARRAELGALMQAEIGAPVAWQAFNVDQAIWQLQLAADLAENLAEAVPHVEGHLVFREAAGVCLGIAPWNAPLVLGVRAIATALACGNAAVLKASEFCAGCHLAIGEIMRDAGLPPGVLQIVTHAPEHAEEVVEALIGHDVVRRVNFTGSTRVGRRVAQIAANALKRCLLELSGKSGMVVLEDADLEAAVAAAVEGAFVNQGQVCMSTDRIIVVEPVADAFAAALAKAAQALKAGVGGALGPVISDLAARRLDDLQRDAVAKGAQILAGGTRQGNFLEATVLDHVERGMRVYHEELFGPIVSICRAADAEEAVSIANDSDFGLSAAIWSADPARALALSRQIEVGMCHINTSTLIDRPDMPVGGLKASGYGRFGGFADLDEFTELRWVALGQAGEAKKSA